jgi:hypothetical protein
MCAAQWWAQFVWCCWVIEYNNWTTINSDFARSLSGSQCAAAVTVGIAFYAYEFSINSDGCARSFSSCSAASCIAFSVYKTCHASIY